jgi:hypothetical protein
MTDTTPPPSASGDGLNSPSISDGANQVNSELTQMDAFFMFATDVNIAISAHKTIDGAVETAAEQRPNIG